MEKANIYGESGLFISASFQKVLSKATANGNPVPTTSIFIKASTTRTKNMVMANTLGAIAAYTKVSSKTISSTKLLIQARHRKHSIPRRQIHGGGLDPGHSHRSNQQSELSSQRRPFGRAEDPESYSSSHEAGWSNSEALTSLIYFVFS